MPRPGAAESRWFAGPRAKLLQSSARTCRSRPNRPLGLAGSVPGWQAGKMLRPDSRDSLTAGQQFGDTCFRGGTRRLQVADALNDKDVVFVA